MGFARRLPLALVALGGLGTASVLACGSDTASAQQNATTAQADSQTGQPAATGGHGQLVLADSFQLSGGDLRVDYAIHDGLAGLTYDDGTQKLAFLGADLVTTSSPAGTMVSVVVRRTIDTGGTTFSVLLPRVLVQPGASATVQTPGISASHRFGLVPSRFDEGQLDDYVVTTLQGSAWQQSYRRE